MNFQKVFCSLLLLISLTCVSVGRGLFTWGRTIYQCLHLWEIGPPCSQHLLIASCSSEKKGASWALPAPVLECWWAQYWASHVWVTTVAHFTSLLPTFWLFHSFLPSSVMSSKPCRGQKECLISGGTLDRHFFSSLWSVLSLCLNWCPFKQKLLQPRLEEEFIYVYKPKCLEGSLTPCPLSKSTI